MKLCPLTLATLHRIPQSKKYRNPRPLPLIQLGCERARQPTIPEEHASEREEGSLKGGVPLYPRFLLPFFLHARAARAVRWARARCLDAWRAWATRTSSLHHLATTRPRQGDDWLILHFQSNPGYSCLDAASASQAGKSPP